MKISVEIANRTKKKIKADLVEKVIRKTVKLFGAAPANFSVSVAFVEKKEIQKLNRIYRKKNKITNVLSFSYGLEYNNKGRAPAGELVLCPDIIAKQAKENEVTFQKELVFVLSHGVLHLLGMKHGKKMYELQDEVLYELRI